MGTSDQAWRERIVCDPKVRSGEPTIRGTRVPVSVVVANLAEMSPDELRSHYPQLAPDDIRAALLYAAEASHNTLVA